MIRIATCLLLLPACGSDSAYRAPIETGVLENIAITEASGLARSIAHEDRLWVINDGGSPTTLYAIGHDGSDRGEVSLPELTNIDWEDLASFEIEGTPKLLIADVGDNLSVRDTIVLYVVDEPDRDQKTASLSWQLTLRYPDGSRDVEAVAVDSSEGLVYLLAKRAIPAELYCIPLFPIDAGETNVITATYLGTVGSLPQPTRRDLSQAGIEKNWHWQPTAMAFSADRKLALVLTYRAAYLYARQQNESWFDALQHAPRVFSLPGIREAEAATLVGDRIFITVEADRAPVYQISIDR